MGISTDDGGMTFYTPHFDHEDSIEALWRKEFETIIRAAASSTVLFSPERGPRSSRSQVDFSRGTHT